MFMNDKLSGDDNLHCYLQSLFPGHPVDLHVLRQPIAPSTAHQTLPWHFFPLRFDLRKPLHTQRGIGNHKMVTNISIVSWSSATLKPTPHARHTPRPNIALTTCKTDDGNSPSPMVSRT